jgi:hypothetical protein
MLVRILLLELGPLLIHVVIHLQLHKQLTLQDKASLLQLLIWQKLTSTVMQYQLNLTLFVDDCSTVVPTVVYTENTRLTLLPPLIL